MAILKRRNPRKLHQRVKESVWPTQGWLRTWYYYKHRIFRGGDSTHKITGGLALGAAISFTPFIGTHFVQAVLFSWLFRFNVLASLAGTVLGNPWTFPFLFWTSYTVGAWIVRLAGFGDFIALPDDMNFGELLLQPREFVDYIFNNPVKILLPFGVGGYVAGALFWPLAYGFLYYPVYMLRKAYRKQHLKRLYRKKASGR
ncbi:MAG: DUF2062 domain-containing protein [Rhodospirillales bacterium]|nr:DUF2062 domain-containing protein [Rhodospirillales bacterium]